MHLLRHQLPFLTVFTNSAGMQRKIGPFELPLSEKDHTRLKRTKRDIQNYPENDRRPNRIRYSKKRQADGDTYYSYDVTENRTPSKTRQLVPKLRAEFRTFRPAGPKILTPRKQVVIPLPIQEIGSPCFSGLLEFRVHFKISGRRTMIGKFFMYKSSMTRVIS